jgi:cell division protein FtsB
MAATATASRRARRRAMRAATKRRVRGGERRAPRPVQHIARQVDDAAFAASTRMRRLLAGDRPFLLGLVALLALGVLVLSGPLQSYLDQRDRVDLLERQLGVLESANADLQQRADDLRDPVHQELLARERFGYIRPGEVPYVVVPPERDRAEISSPLEVEQTESRTWFRGAWDALTGLFG